jgi:GcrA cell cycle regulator
MEWNDETIARLCGLWVEGLSTAEIGRRMCVSKNAVVGKAHRLSLPSRPSPIRRDGHEGSAPRRPTPRRIIGPTLPPLPAGVAGHLSPLSPSVPLSRRVAPGSNPVPLSAPSSEVATRQLPIRAVLPRYGRLSTCCWPIGEPGSKTFRFCDAEATVGKPYCDAHVQLAYVKVRERREEAA